MKPLWTPLFVGVFAALLGAAALAAGFLAAGIAMAEPPPTRGPGCFLRRDVYNFSAPNDRTLYIRVGVSQVWRLDLMTDCTGLSFRQAFGLEARPASPWICSPLDATVIVRQPGFHMRCPVTAMHHLSPAEVAALPKRDRP